MAEIRLRGMTWDHSRGYDPMVATAAEWAQRHPGVTITWEKRSLQAFADRPIREMADHYDLMVIDHPHVGEVAAEGNLLALDGCGHDAELATLAQQSVGLSHPSYQFGGRQWALAIDAATPVAAFRPDLIAAAPRRWEDAKALAREGRVAFALVPINALMTFFGLARNLDYPVAEDPGRLMAREHGAHVLDELREMAAHLDPRCFACDPIAIYDWVSGQADAPAYSPFGYGYTNYSRDGYCRYPLVFADAPGFGDNGPRGTVLGGTGIAVSAFTGHPEAAADYAFWIAGAECQKGLFFASGGQPGNAAAWEDNACNAACRDFFRNTRATLDSAWLRPRYNGYMSLQDRAGDIVQACLKGATGIAETLDALDATYRETRR
jgi:multiple sugar transport system substrate-binding protein